MDIGDLERKLGIDGLSADEQMELVGALQKSAQTRLEIANQEAIGKSTEVVIQGLKKIKSDLETRFSQLNATIESKASSLRDGKDGKDGKNGKDGMVLVSPLLVLISMVALLLGCLVVLNSMLVRLLLLILQKPSRLLLMVVALLSLYSIA